MDIWAWVTELHTQLQEENPRLAWLLVYVPHYVVHNDVEMVDSLIPEALALSKSMNHPWMEVYFRHWNLQSRILQRSLVKSSMNEAIDLLERSHREDTIDCPQTICVSQDICCAYGLADGPGYAEERLKVAGETLERINPAWPCWRCISEEYTDALLDSGKPEEAMAFLEKQERATQVARPEKYSPFSMRGSRTETMLALGRYEELLDYTIAAEEYCREQGDVFEFRRKIDLARIYTRLERWEDAKAVLPAWKDMEHYLSEIPDWTESFIPLLQNESIPFEPVHFAHLRQAIQRMRDEGIYRNALEVTVKLATTLLEFDQKPQAERLLLEAEELVQELYKPLNANELLSTLRDKTASTPWEIELPDSPEELIEQMGMHLSSSKVLAGQKKWPEHWELTLMAGHVWELFGFRKEAEDLFLHFLKQNPEHVQAVQVLAEGYLEQKDFAALEAHLTPYADTTDPLMRKMTQWLLVLGLEEQREIDTAIVLLESMLQEFPEALHFLAKQALLLRSQRRYEEAMQCLNRYIALVEEGDSMDWERMIVGTVLEDWKAVNHSALRLGMDLGEAEGPFYEPSGLCLLTFDGEDDEHVALRVGPVTAQVLRIAFVDSEQHYNDLVLFNPLPRNEVDPEDPEALLLYEVETVLKPGNYQTFTLNGQAPDEAQIDELEAVLEPFGVAFVQTSSNLYELTDEETGEILPGFYAVMAAPSDCDLQGLEAALTKLIARWEIPMLWTELLDRLGEEEKRSQQLALGQRFEMVL
jgi:tetratricopeptide (TPR) repeat protein